MNTYFIVQNKIDPKHLSSKYMYKYRLVHVNYKSSLSVQFQLCCTLYLYLVVFFRGSELIMKISSLLSSKTSTTERKELNELKDQHR